MTDVSGILRDASGTVLANIAVTLAYHDQLVGYSGGAVAKNNLTFTTDGSGLLTMTGLVAGAYTLSVSVPRNSGAAVTEIRKGVMVVDGSASMTLEEALTASIGTVTPSVLAQAVAAKDAAETALALTVAAGALVASERNATNAAALASLTDGATVVMAGRAYVVDSAATGAASATNDLGVDGLVPWGDTIWLEQVGCALDGTDETSTIQAAFDIAAARGLHVRCGTGTIKAGTITVAAGVRDIDLSAAEWIGGSTAMAATPRLDVTAAPTVPGRRYDVRMNMANGDLIGIEGLLINSDFGGVHIYGYTNHALINHIGIRPEAGSDNCDFRGYHWDGYDNPTQRGIGVHCTGTVAAYGGFFPSGVLARATVPVTNMRIHGATFINGSYAWVANGAEFSTFADNHCEGQNHRGVQFTSGCYRCATSNNMFKNFKSTAVLFSYGATECSSFNDTVDAPTYKAGEAAFNVNTGAVGTHIIGATGYAAMNFGVYVATGASGTIVEGCKLEGFYVGGIVAQSDWADPADAGRVGLIFDRPNYGPASDLNAAFTNWAKADLDRVIIRNNSVGNGYPGRATVAFGAIQMDGEDGVSVYDVRATFQGNKVHNVAQVGYDFAVWKESGECKVRLLGNDFRANGIKAAYGGATVSWSDFIEAWRDNGAFDKAVISEGITLTGATPSVATPAPADFAQIYTLGHTSATNVTYFNDGFDGQTISLWGNVNATLVHDTAKIRLSGSVDATLNANQMITLTRRSGVWFEVWRTS